MRDLVDTLTSELSLLGEGLQARNGRNEYLHHDGRGDIWVDAKRGDAQVRQRSAAEQVQEAEKLLLLERLRQLLRIDAGNRHLRDESEDDQHPQREQDLRTQVRDAHRVNHGLD